MIYNGLSEVQSLSTHPNINILFPSTVESSRRAGRRKADMSNEKACASDRHRWAVEKSRDNKERREEGWKVEKVGGVAIAGDAADEWWNGEEITLRRAAEWRQINLNDCFFPHISFCINSTHIFFSESQSQCLNNCNFMNLNYHLHTSRSSGRARISPSRSFDFLDLSFSSPLFFLLSNFSAYILFVFADASRARRRCRIACIAMIWTFVMCLVSKSGKDNSTMKFTQLI